MNEDWRFYFSYDGDHPMSVMVDLGRRDSAPDDELPDVVSLRLTMRQPRPDGLSSNEEFNRLNEIDDVVTATSEVPRLQYVGRVTGQGYRDFLFYTADGPAAVQLLARRMGEFTEYEFQSTLRSDPDWEVYLEILYPSPREMQTIQNQHVLEALATHGDVPEIERDVTHWIYFPTASARDRFAAEALARGYREVERDKEKDEESQADRFKLVLAKAHPVDFMSVNETTLELFDLAGECGGNYDGWETSVESGGLPSADTT